MEDRFREYLGDESGWKGSAEGLALPESPEEAADTLASAFRKGVPVTVQGGRTGVCGGAVPQGGLLMGLRGLDQVLGLEELTGGGWGMRVQAGVSLAEIQRRSGRYFWPSDPTETTAAVGGILSVGARGPLGHFYGDPRQYVEELRAADSRGRIRTLRRGESSIAGFLEEAASSLPYPVLAQGLKPLGLTPEDDSVDLFLGTEGILGVILETVLRLRPAPAEAWGIGFFFPDSRRAADFSEALKEVSPEGGGAVLAAAEFLDTPSLAYAEGMRGQAAKLKGLPPVHPGWGGMDGLGADGGEDEEDGWRAGRAMGGAGACCVGGAGPGCRAEGAAPGPRGLGGEGRRGDPRRPGRGGDRAC